MSVLVSLRDGSRRVNRAPGILAGVWILTLVAGLPLAAALRTSLADHLGQSLAADAAAAGANYDWMQEFADQASGIGLTFKPTVIGFGAILDNLSAFIDDTARPIAIVATASLYVLAWIFLAGGIVDRLARDRAIGAHGFFAACGVFFFRFLRLAIVQWLVYAFLFAYLHDWLFDTFYPRITHEMSVERTAFLTRLALYLVFGLLVAAAALVFDYAKVRAVVEDRRSMLSAIGAALGFVRRNTAAATGAFAANCILFVVVVGVYALVAPGAGGAGPSMWVGFALGQLYVIGRLWVKLLFWASETSLFQRRLAHAGYTARLVPVWPDSPTAEALRG
jgi:hypothetical protein